MSEGVVLFEPRGGAANLGPAAIAPQLGFTGISDFTGRHSRILCAVNTYPVLYNALVAYRSVMDGLSDAVACGKSVKRRDNPPPEKDGLPDVAACPSLLG